MATVIRRDDGKPVISRGVGTTATLRPQGLVGPAGLGGSDAGVADYVNNTGSLTRAALSATYAPVADTLNLRRLADQGQAELRATSAAHRMDYEDAAIIDERWSDLSNWASPGSHTVGSGKMFAASGGTQQMGRAFQPGSQRFRLSTKFDLPSGVAASGFLFIGFVPTAVGTNPNGADAIGIGVDPATYKPVIWKGANITAAVTASSSAGGGSSITSGQTFLSSTPFAAGTVKVTIIGDENQLSFVLSDLAHTVEHRFTIARSALTINQLAIWSGDSRFASGIATHPVGIKFASSTLTPRTIATGTATTTVTESWANLSNWAFNTNGQVSGGKLYSKGTASPAGVVRPIVPGGSFSSVTWTSTITVPSVASGTGLLLLGVTTDASALSATAANMFAIGIDIVSKQPVYWLGSGVGGASTTTSLGAALANGDYKVTVSLSSTSCTLTIASTDGVTTYGTITKTFTQLGATPVNEIIWISNSAASAGTFVGATVGATSIATTYPNDLSYEGGAPSVVFTKPLTSSTSLARVLLPASYDSRKPLPLVLHAHGHGRSAISAFDDVQLRTYFEAIAAAGYIVASADAQGDGWGKPATVADYEQLYRYVRDHYAISGVLLHGISMGGLSCLTMLAQRVVPNILGYYGVAPVCSLRKIYDADWGGTFKAEVTSAFSIAAGGSDFDAKTSGYAPEVRQGWEFRGVPTRLSLVLDDATVPPADHGVSLLAKVAPFAPEASRIDTATGGHIANAAFNSGDAISTFARWTAA